MSKKNKITKRVTLNYLISALQIAAEESYKNEVIDTLMVDNTIGPNGEYYDKGEWLSCKIEDWIDRAVIMGIA